MRDSPRLERRHKGSITIKIFPFALCVFWVVAKAVNCKNKIKQSPGSINNSNFLPSLLKNQVEWGMCSQVGQTNEHILTASESLISYSNERFNKPAAHMGLSVCVFFKWAVNLLTRFPTISSFFILFFLLRFYYYKQICHLSYVDLY